MRAFVGLQLATVLLALLLMVEHPASAQTAA
jgi:hypothetical protein